MIPVKRLNHAVLYVRDLDRSVEFYKTAFGFEEIAREGGQMAFLRAAGSTNHHDLGLLAVGAERAATAAWLDRPLPPRVGGRGIEDLKDAQVQLANLDALSGQSDHGATKSLYGADPDGNEFEVMWMMPREEWGEYDRRGIIAPLNMAREVAQHGGATK